MKVKILFYLLLAVFFTVFSVGSGYAQKDFVSEDCGIKIKGKEYIVPCESLNDTPDEAAYERKIVEKLERYLGKGKNIKKKEEIKGIVDEYRGKKE